MSEQKYFKHESYQDRDSIGTYIREITNGLEKGELFFADKNGEIAVNTGDLMLLELKVKKKSHKNRISFRIEWKNGKNPQEIDEDTVNNDSFLKIESTILSNGEEQ